MHEQEREVEKALIGRGKYELRSQYQSWHISEMQWCAMTTPQREQHLKRLACASLSDVSDTGKDVGTSIASICFGRDQSISSTLSVHINSFADDVRVPQNCLEGIWNKAAELLKADDAIAPAPGVGNDAKFVLSYRGKKPHLVIPKKGITFACDSDCPNWKALGICAHSVAVAELCKKLPASLKVSRRQRDHLTLQSLRVLLCQKEGGEREVNALESERHPHPLRHEWKILCCLLE